MTGAVLITLMIVVLPGLFRNLPQPALAAVVITAALSPADLPGAARLWRQRKTEFALTIAAFLGLDVLPGIAVAVGLSILNVFRRAWRPYQAILGVVPGLPGYHDIASHPDAHRLADLVLYRFDAPLFFANARTFRDGIRRLAATEPPPDWIVVAAEPITDVDSTAADTLEDLGRELDELRIRLVFAELKDPVRAKIERYGLTSTLAPGRLFPTLEAAVAAFAAGPGGTPVTSPPPGEETDAAPGRCSADLPTSDHGGDDERSGSDFRRRGEYRARRDGPGGLPRARVHGRRNAG